MRLTSPLQEAALAWLSTLKTAQLQTVAHAAGIRSAGPKGNLQIRLRRELQESEFLGPQTQSPSGQNGNGKDLSIISIDMGIRNLAFAHLTVPAPGTSGPPRPKLHAWHRLAVTALPIGPPGTLKNHDGLLIPNNVVRTLVEKIPTTRRKNGYEKEEEDDLVMDEETAAAEALAFDSTGLFGPDIYASHAYTLLTSLIAAYKPTHILVERQRFRSSGSSTIQEWTLRVGIFEGMLYAVAGTLRKLGHCDVTITSVDPKQVARYWNMEAPTADEISQIMDIKEEAKDLSFQARARLYRERKKMTKKYSPRDVKKLKINLVGGWLNESTSADVHQHEQAKLDVPPPTSLTPPDYDTRQVVDSFLRRWNNGMTRSYRLSRLPDGGKPKLFLDKLDDLADCLLQAMTWLQWQDTRAKIVREGYEAMPQVMRDMSVVRKVQVNPGMENTIRM